MILKTTAKIIFTEEESEALTDAIGIIEEIKTNLSDKKTLFPYSYTDEVIKHCEEAVEHILEIMESDEIVGFV